MSMPDSSARPLRSAIEVPTEPRQSADNLPFVWAFEVLRRRYRTLCFLPSSPVHSLLLTFSWLPPITLRAYG
jgi:hypothetical protein